MQPGYTLSLLGHPKGDAAGQPVRSPKQNRLAPPPECDAAKNRRCHPPRGRRLWIFDETIQKLPARIRRLGLVVAFSVSRCAWGRGRLEEPRGAQALAREDGSVVPQCRAGQAWLIVRTRRGSALGFGSGAARCWAGRCAPLCVRLRVGTNLCWAYGDMWLCVRLKVGRCLLRLSRRLLPAH
jgi:hypothetical protein